MSTGNGLPPLPRPPAALRTVEVSLSLPGDVLDDLKRAAKEQLGTEDMDVAVAMCVQLWRYPPAAPAVTRKPRVKSR